MCERCKELANAITRYLGDIEARNNGNPTNVRASKFALLDLLKAVRRDGIDAATREW